MQFLIKYNILQFILSKLHYKSVTIDSYQKGFQAKEVCIKAAFLRCVIRNNINSSFSDDSNKTISNETLKFITEIWEKQNLEKNLFLFNTYVIFFQFLFNFFEI